MPVALRKYATFSGRSTRSEFWWYFVSLWILVLIAVFFDVVAGFSDIVIVTRGDTSSIHYVYGGGPLMTVLMLATIIPNLALTVRRLHDTDRSGWWLLLMLVPIIGWTVLFVFAALDSTVGPNRFGPDPKADERATATPAANAHADASPSA